MIDEPVPTMPEMVPAIRPTARTNRNAKGTEGQFFDDDIVPLFWPTCQTAFGNTRNALIRQQSAALHGVVFRIFVEPARQARSHDPLRVHCGDAADSMLAAGAGYDHLLTTEGVGHADRGKLSLR